jgi:hypothetical protein
VVLCDRGSGGTGLGRPSRQPPGRTAASRSIKALIAIATRAECSRTPVSLAAFSINWSSIVTAVCIAPILDTLNQPRPEYRCAAKKLLEKQTPGMSQQWFSAVSYS